MLHKKDNFKAQELTQQVVIQILAQVMIHLVVEVVEHWVVHTPSIRIIFHNLKHKLIQMMTLKLYMVVMEHHSNQMTHFAPTKNVLSKPRDAAMIMMGQNCLLKMVLRCRQ